MDELLLTTKLYIPSPCQTLLLRPQLIAALSKALVSRLTLVSAPAGYGKTTLVSSWLHATEIASTWISLEDGDNDPIRFLQYFITALQRIFPAIQLDWMVSPQGIQSAPLHTRFSAITNEITRLDAPFVLVLDDFHTINAPSILEMVSFLIEHAPSQLHMVIISRTDPPLPLSKFRVRGQLVEIRAEQLRFTHQEMAAFLNQVMGLELSTGDIAALDVRTEGWIAGLQLAALSMQGRKDISAFVSAFTGSHYYIMDYLTEEVLKLQPERVRQFLLQTSILASMCAPLCEAVVGALEPSGIETFDAGSRDQLSNSNEILEYLERSNLFIVPLDGRRRWFRYHHLFTDVLNLRLKRLYPELLPELHRRASCWYEQNEIIPEAIRHALLAKDPERAAQLVEAHGCSLIMSGESFTLLEWVEAVRSFVRTRPWLAVLKAWALALTGNVDQVEAALHIAEGLVSSLPLSDEVKIVLGSITTIRAYLANIYGQSRLAAEDAQQALDYLPDSNTFTCSLRSVATSVLGDASWLNGDLDIARQTYMEAAQISRAAGNLYMTIIANSNLADVLIEQGDLHLAARIYSEALEQATRPDGQRLPFADHLYQGLGELHYEWNRLDEAGGYVHDCIELCRQWGNSNQLAKSYVLLARLEQAGGHSEESQEAMRAAGLLVSEQRLSPRLALEVKLAAASWWIAQERPERAAYLVQQLGITSDGFKSPADIPYSRVPEYLLLVRLLLAGGDPDAALLISKRLLQIAEAGKQIGSVIELLILQALAWQGKKDTDRALAVLEKALSLAQPEGYMRVFLDEGEPLAKLLFQAKSQRKGQEYASELLSALGGVSSVEQSAAQNLIEPLTLRELEVLKFLEVGYSNPEIASRLFISIPTVKRHLSNIFTKLGAKSRTQAVSLGRELRLLD